MQFVSIACASLLPRISVHNLIINADKDDSGGVDIKRLLINLDSSSMTYKWKSMDNAFSLAVSIRIREVNHTVNRCITTSMRCVSSNRNTSRSSTRTHSPEQYNSNLLNMAQDRVAPTLNVVQQFRGMWTRSPNRIIDIKKMHRLEVERNGLINAERNGYERDQDQQTSQT